MKNRRISCFSKIKRFFCIESEDWVKKSMKAKANTSSGIKKQTKIVMAQALEDDPTVFQYDEVRIK